MFKLPHIDSTSTRFRVIRYFVTIFCGLFLIEGIITFAVSTWLAVQSFNVCKFTQMYNIPVYILLSSAVMTISLAILSLVRAHCNINQQVFRIFIFVFIIIVGLELVSAIIALSQRIHLDFQLQLDMMNEFTDIPNPSCITSIQTELTCCGVIDYTDMLHNENNVTEFPQSCLCDCDSCVVNENTVGISVYATTCFQIISERFKSHNTLLRVLGPVLTVIQTMFLVTVSYCITRIQSNSLVGAYAVKYQNDIGQNHENSQQATNMSVISQEQAENPREESMNVNKWF